MRKPLRLFAALLLLAFAYAFSGAAAAQDFILPYNKAPETAPEFWAATKYEMQLGNHKRAAEMLQKFAERLANLGEADQNKLLLAIHDRDGLSSLLRLANLEPVKATKAKDAASGKDIPLGDALIKRMTQALEGRLGDQARIEFFVGNLGKTPEERGYAMLQLKLAGDRAVPALLKALADKTREKDHGNIVAALAKMDKNFGPAALAAFDSPSDYLRSALIRAFELRSDKRVVPYLWWLAGSPATSAALKAQASSALAKFAGSAEPLTDARGKLTAEAERWYRKQNDTPAGTATIWSWDNETGNVKATPATGASFDDHQAMFWAKKALDVDAAYVPAQVLFLSAAIDRAVAQAGPDQPLAKAAPETALLLASASAPLLDAVLDRALTEGRTNVALGAVRAIGASGDPRALRPESGGVAPLARALSYPDGRVQFAAAEAVLSIPMKEAAPGASRVVGILARSLSGSGPRKALVGHGKTDEGQKLAGLFKQAGFEAQAFSNGRALAQAANDEGDVALLAIHVNLPDPGLPFTMSQLAENPNTRALPILLFTEATDDNVARELSRRYPKVKVVSPTPATADLLKAEVETMVKDADAAPLTDAERKAQGPRALELLKKVALGEIPGYDARAADGALERALASDELAGGAAAVLALRPGKPVQAALADVVLKDVRTPAVRAAVAAGLRGNLQRFGVLLAPEQIEALAKLSATATDPAFKLEADRLAAFLQPSAGAEGQRLLKFPLLSPAKAADVKPSDAKPEPKAPADVKDDKADEKKDGA